MEFQPARDHDLDLIAEQLGRRPRGPVGIAVSCPAGHPAVLINHPLHRRGDQIAPFPTLYWLSCPALVRDVSRLEMTGLIGELESRLSSDETLAAGLKANHESYIAERWSLLDENDRAAVRGAGFESSLRDRGIGGLARRASLKCLHLHLAHHLAAGNVIGQLLVEEFGISPCPTPGAAPHSTHSGS